MATEAKRDNMRRRYRTDSQEDQAFEGMDTIKVLQIIHASGLSGTDETDCGLYVSNTIQAVDTRLTGNINKVTCKKCLNIVFRT